MTKKKTNKHKIKIADKRHNRTAAQGAEAQEESATHETPEQQLMENLRKFTSGAVDSVIVTPQAELENGEAQAAAVDPEIIEIDWKQQAAQHLDLAQRKQADLDNFRKRAMQEKDDARRNAVEALLYDLFPVLDGLHQAAHTFKDKAIGEDSLLDGVRNSIKVLDSAFGNHGISRINETGVAFDANLHQPLAVEESSEVESETVAEIYTVGYMLGERVLKPAMVKIVKPVGS